MNILAVGAHWDDIELGCGLTLKRLADNGHKIFSVVVCSSLYGKNENEGMSEEDALESGTEFLQNHWCNISSHTKTT